MMKKIIAMIECAVLAGFLVCVSPLVDEAGAQWQVPNNTIPIGRGAGTGFKTTIDNDDPSLSALRGVTALTGTNTIVLNMGITNTAPYGAWLQSKNTLSGGGGDGTAYPIHLNPLGGVVGIQAGSTLQTSVDLQVGENWCDSTYLPFGSPCGIFGGAHIFDGLTVWGRTLGAAGSAQALTSFAFADNAAARGAFPLYIEAHRMTQLDYAGSEIAVVNRYNSVNYLTPYGLTSADGFAAGLQFDCGNSLSISAGAQYSCSHALNFTRNANADQPGILGFGSGIIFQAGSLDMTQNDPAPALSFPSSASEHHAIMWWTSTTNKVWQIYSIATSLSANNTMVLGDSGVDFNTYVRSTVASGAIDHAVISGTVDMRLQANSASSLGAAGTISNHSWQITVNNTEIGRVTSSGLTLGVAGTLAGQLTLAGVTSGGLNIKAAAAAGSNTLTLPAGTTDFSATGGTSQVVKQTSAGAAFTVARLACADLSDAAATCSSAAVGSITGLGTGVATWLATPSSANLATAVTDETGSGALVFGTSPSIASPTFTGTIAASGPFGAWTSYTPTLGCLSGSLTSASSAGRYWTLGKTTFVSITATITTNGTCAGYLTATLPNTSNNNFMIVGRDINAGVNVFGVTTVGTSTVIIQKLSDGSYPGVDGSGIVVSGSYELQ